MVGEGQKTILLVEDEGIIAMAETAALRNYGYAVVTANSGEAALRALEGSPRIDLVLMDINLGKGMSGTEAAQLILAGRDLPLIFLSSHTEREIVERTEGITSYGYIVKNTGDTVLIASIKMAFRLFDAKMKEKEIEEGLRESQALYHSFVEHLPAGVFRKDSEGRYIFVNSIFCRLKGLREDEILGKTPSELSEYEAAVEAERPSETRLKQRTLAIQGQSNHEAIMRSGKTIEVEEVYTTREGTAEYLQVVKSPVFSSTGEVIGSQGIQFDVTERKLAAERINALLREKELLLKETHHRVKNNLGSVNALLSLEAEAQEDERTKSILNDAARRVRSMEILYDKLYRSDNHGELGLSKFLSPLVEEVVGLYAHGARIGAAVSIEDIAIGASLLSPLGIIVNELLTNSLKHAFRGRKSGRIALKAAKTGDTVTITFEDDGVGLPESVSVESSTGFGLQLVGMLVQQVKGAIGIERGAGTRFTIVFKA